MVAKTDSPVRTNPTGERDAFIMRSFAKMPVLKTGVAPPKPRTRLYWHEIESTLVPIYRAAYPAAPDVIAHIADMCARGVLARSEYERRKGGVGWFVASPKTVAVAGGDFVTKALAAMRA